MYDPDPLASCPLIGGNCPKVAGEFRPIDAEDERTAKNDLIEAGIDRRPWQIPLLPARRLSSPDELGTVGEGKANDAKDERRQRHKRENPTC